MPSGTTRPRQRMAYLLKTLIPFRELGSDSRLSEKYQQQLLNTAVLRKPLSYTILYCVSSTQGPWYFFCSLWPHQKQCVRHRQAVVKKRNAAALRNLPNHLVSVLLFFFFYSLWLQLIQSGQSRGRGRVRGAVICLWEPSLMFLCATLCVILADVLESVTGAVVLHILLLLCGSTGIKSQYLTQNDSLSNSWSTDVRPDRRILEGLTTVSGFELPKGHTECLFLKCNAQTSKKNPLSQTLRTHILSETGTSTPGIQEALISVCQHA